MNGSRTYKMSIIGAIGFGTLIAFAGCKKADSDGSGSAAAAAVSANPIVVVGDPEAAKAVKATLEKTWLETPDGWISEFSEPIVARGGGPVTVGSSFHQFKELKFKIKTDQLSDIGKQTYQYHGSAELTSFASRYYFVPANGNGEGKWTEWSTTDPKIYFVVTKEKGVWFMTGGYDHNIHVPFKAKAYIGDGGIYLWNGKKPDAATVAKLN